MDESGALDAFPAPKFFTLGTSAPGSFEAPDLSGILPAIFALVFFVWVAFTLVIVYHWLRYGHRSFFMVPALIVHVAVSILLLLVTASGI